MEMACNGLSDLCPDRCEECPRYMDDCDGAGVGMNQAIRIKMAEREGWTRGRIGHITGHQYWEAPSQLADVIVETGQLPTYTNDADLDRYIRGMDKDTLQRYAYALYVICGENCEDMVEYQASEAQKLEAIIKAEGLE